MVERRAEAIRDGQQAADERHMAQVEMEQALIAQEQYFERGTGVPIVEQADGSDNAHDDGRNVIVATGDGAHGSEGGSGGSLGSPGAGTDPSETQTSWGQDAADTLDHGPVLDDNIVLEHGERTFEGDGRHALEDQ